MPTFILIPGRTHHDDGSPSPRHETNVLTMNHDDMARLGVAAGDLVRVRTDRGTLDVACRPAELPAGIVAMTHETLGAGASDNGIEVAVEPI